MVLLNQERGITLRKFLIYTIALLILVFTFNHNNISAYNETDFKPSSKFVSLINALKSNDDVMVTLNGEDATARFKYIHQKDLLENNYQAIFESLRINEYMISDYRKSSNLKQDYLNSESGFNLLSANPYEATVKMYFYGEHYFIRTATQPPYTTIELLVNFYTFARFHTITKAVVWADRPYLEYITGNLNGGSFANGNGNATRTISGQDVSYSSTWVVPVVSWSGMQGGYGYYITLAYPRVYFPTNNRIFTPWNWWDGSGTTNSIGESEQ